MIPLLLATLLALEKGAALDGLDEALRALASDTVRERDAAERWLAAHLTTEDYARIAEAALAGDAEVRQRLVRAIGGDDRHLGLALFLAGERDPGLHALGEEALHDCVAGFDVRIGELGLREKGLERALRDIARESQPRLVQLDLRRPLEELCEELELFGGLPSGLAVDGSIATRISRKPDEELVGPWNEVLARLASSTGVMLEGHGLDPVPEGEARSVPGFLLLTPEPGAARRTGVEVIVGWLHELATPAKDPPSDPLARLRAARNLAASGFPAAIRWMEERARRYGDEAALEGLLRAAGTGRVAPFLTERSTLESLVRRVTEDLDQGTADGRVRASRTLAGLVRIGCLDPLGQSLSGSALAGFEGASARGRWVRLFLSERTGCADEEARDRSRELLERDGVPPALRLQALGTFVSLSAGPPGEPLRIPDLSGLLATARDAREADRLGNWLELAGVEPPRRDQGSALALLSAWMWRAEDEPAADALLALLDRPGDVFESGEHARQALQPWVGRGEGDRVRGVIERATERSGERALELERLALLLEVLPAARIPALLASWTRAPLDPRPDLQVLAVLAGHGEALQAAQTARKNLLASLERALQENREPASSQALIRAVERCSQGLQAAGRDAEAADFAQGVRRLLRAHRSAALSASIERASFRTPPGVETLVLSRAAAELLPPPGL